MKVKIINAGGVVLGGIKRVKDEVIDVDDKTGKYLLGSTPQIATKDLTAKKEEKGSETKEMKTEGTKTKSVIKKIKDKIGGTK